MQTFSEYCEERFLFSDAMTMDMMIGAISAYLQQHDLEILRAAGVHSSSEARTHVKAWDMEQQAKNGEPRYPYVRLEYHGESGIVRAEEIVLDGSAFKTHHKFFAFTNLAYACNEASRKLHMAVFTASQNKEKTDVTI